MIFSIPPPNTTLKFGNDSYPGSTGEAVHFIPRARLPGLEAFSRWKTNKKSSLDDLEMSISTSHGPNTARLVVESLRNTGPFRVPSLRINLDDGEVFHLPPKIALLVKMALQNAKEDEKALESLHGMMADYGSIFEADSLIDMAADLIMGKMRLHSIACAEKGSEWENTMMLHDPEASLHEMIMHDASFAAADYNVYSNIRSRVFGYAFANDLRRIEAILAVKLGLAREEDMGPESGEVRFFIQCLDHERNQYPIPEVFTRIELNVPMGAECTGHRDKGPISMHDDIA
jgi:hypothetical protein